MCYSQISMALLHVIRYKPFARKLSQKVALVDRQLLTYEQYFRIITALSFTHFF